MLTSSFALDFFLPVYCLGCSSPIPFSAIQTCPICRETLEQPRASDFEAVLNEGLLDARGDRAEAPPGIALWFYHRGGPVPGMHRRIKYGGAARLGERCGELLGARLLCEHELCLEPAGCPPIVVPIPLHAVRRRERGFNQAEKIARGVARHLDLNLDTTTLTRRDYEQSQVGRSRRERFAGLGGAFECVRVSGSDAPVILVDDVVTTGATVLSATLTLREAGHARIFVAALGLVEL